MTVSKKLPECGVCLCRFTLTDSLGSIVRTLDSNVTE